MSEVVYAIGSAQSNLVKIGRTTELPERLAAIQRMSPVRLLLLWSTGGGYALESALHRRFKAYRQHGEWFDFGGADPVATIAAAIDAIEVERREREVSLVAEQRAEVERIQNRQVLELARQELDAARKDLEDEIVAALRRKEKPTDVAKRAGYTYTTIRNLARDNGIPPDERYVRTQKRDDA